MEVLSCTRILRVPHRGPSAAAPSTVCSVQRCLKYNRRAGNASHYGLCLYQGVSGIAGWSHHFCSSIMSTMLAFSTGTAHLGGVVNIPHARAHHWVLCACAASDLAPAWHTRTGQRHWQGVARFPNQVRRKRVSKLCRGRCLVASELRNGHCPCGVRLHYARACPMEPVHRAQHQHERRSWIWRRCNIACWMQLAVCTGMLAALN